MTHMPVIDTCFRSCQMDCSRQYGVGIQKSERSERRSRFFIPWPEEPRPRPMTWCPRALFVGGKSEAEENRRAATSKIQGVFSLAYTYWIHRRPPPYLPVPTTSRKRWQKLRLIDIPESGETGTNGKLDCWAAINKVDMQSKSTTRRWVGSNTS